MKVEVELPVLILFLLVYILLIVILLEITYFENHLLNMRELIIIACNVKGG